MPRTAVGPGLLGALVALLSLAPPGAAAQEAWNGDRALGLVERARERRQEPVLDSALQSYRAEVTGHIYFLVDREGEPEPVLLRADQVALTLFWGQPDRTKQIIRGMRSEEQFPIRDFRYYLDRYTVIQNGFGDEIRVGEGRDVRNVPHPLAPGAEAVYDYRLADSMTLRLPGQPDPLRVYEIQVRPEDFDIPAIVGSLFLERSRGDLVRLAFTFTPSAYLDPRNERVEIMLENALWEGRYWLPREQRLLVRRELPEFDFDVGTVIRAALRVTDYELNVELPASFFRGREVVVGEGPEGLRSYAFEEGLYEGLDDVGLAPGTDPGTLDEVDVEAIAGRILREKYLRGVPNIRFFVPSGSHVLRFDRSEGLVTGAGVSFGAGQSQLALYGGWAWGAEKPLVELAWEIGGRESTVDWAIEGYLNRPLDLGLRPAAAGAISSLSAALLGDDFRDIIAARGVTVSRSTGAPGAGRLRLAASYERHEAYPYVVPHAPFDDAREFRPVVAAPAVNRGAIAADYERRFRLAGADARVSPVAAIDWWFGVGPENGGAGAGRSTVRVLADAEATWRSPGYSDGVRLRATAGLLVGDAPRSHHWLIGGRNTLPGHPFHEYGGPVAAVTDITAWRTVVPRWLQLRLLAAAGLAGPQSETFADPSGTWHVHGTPGILGSVGAGVGFVDGLLRLDYAYPLGGDAGDGSLILSIDPRVWPFL